MISTIPAMPGNRNNGRGNGTRVQDAAASLFRNELLKIVEYSSFVFVSLMYNAYNEIHLNRRLF